MQIFHVSNYSHSLLLRSVFSFVSSTFRAGQALGMQQSWRSKSSHPWSPGKGKCIPPTLLLPLKNKTLSLFPFGPWPPTVPSITPLASCISWCSSSSRSPRHLWSSQPPPATYFPRHPKMRHKMKGVEMKEQQRAWSPRKGGAQQKHQSAEPLQAQTVNIVGSQQEAPGRGHSNRALLASADPWIWGELQEVQRTTAPLQPKCLILKSANCKTLLKSISIMQFPWAKRLLSEAKWSSRYTNPTDTPKVFWPEVSGLSQAPRLYIAWGKASRKRQSCGHCAMMVTGRLRIASSHMISTACKTKFLPKFPKQQWKCLKIQSEFTEVRNT